jgi:hypothetical protein
VTTKIKDVPIEPILEHITKSCYDPMHGFGGGIHICWVVDAEPLLDLLKELSGMTEDEMHHAFDDARVRVHGPNVKGGR